MLLVTLVGGTACPSSQSAPASPAPEAVTPGQSVAPPILALLGQREHLSLTPEQVVALDSIHQRWSAENDRLTHRGTAVMSGLGGVSVERRLGVETGSEAQANHSRAAKAVEEVLTPEQKRAVCDLGRRGNRAWPWCAR